MYVSECRETLLEHSMQAERVWLGEIGIAEATEWIESTEGSSVSSVSFSVFSDSNFAWLTGKTGGGKHETISQTRRHRR
jgi:hypothetical protein